MHQELDAASLTALIGLVRKHTGIAMTDKKSVLLEGRLRPRMRALALTSYQAYLSLVERDHGEVQRFINMVTTNDTVFFRTPHVWEYFYTQFLPEWWASHAGEVLHIWSAAAASGEEAYSIAMLCQEFQLACPRFRYRILATDISTEVLASGRAGVYGGRSVERLRASHPQFLKKYFTAQDDSMAVVADLKTHLEFAAHNLLGRLHSSDKFDLVFLRNVLIYFDEVNQQRVVEQARHAMHDAARLVLGESESLARLNTDYRYELPLVYSIGKVAA